MRQSDDVGRGSPRGLEAGSSVERLTEELRNLRGTLRGRRLWLARGTE